MKDHNIISKLFFNAVKFKPTDNPNKYVVEDTTLKRMCEICEIRYVPCNQ